MKKYFILGAVAVVALLFIVQNAGAAQDRVLATNNKSGKTVLIPPHAVQVSNNVFSLGTSLDKEHGDVVEGYAIVHYKEGHGKGNGKGNGKPDKGSGSSSCYGFLAKDAKWKTVEPWIVNPSNPDGISDASVFSILDDGIGKWEDAADGAVDNGVSIDVLGSGSLTSSVLQADTSSMDNQNEVYFDSLDEGTIGVTIVWGIFGGRPALRELREWDQVYNTFYEWSDAGVSDKMDFENIAVHELGHSVGLGDLYEVSCADETMYGFGSEGETKKRDLNAGDIEGMSKLY